MGREPHSFDIRSIPYEAEQITKKVGAYDEGTL
jgi:hypothetical protein